MFPNLLVGTYTVTVEKDGFKKAVQKGIIVNSNQVSEAKVDLELGSVSATVEVEAGADLVKTESSTLEATFSGRAVQDIPINTTGGDVKEYSVYAPERLHNREVCSVPAGRLVERVRGSTDFRLTGSMTIRLIPMVRLSR